MQVRRGHIRGFVRGKDRKESLSRQKRMDQLKDRFQVQGGEREKTLTSDDEDTYGPKISGADIKTGKQKIIVADSISESSHVGDLGAKRKCEGLNYQSRKNQVHDLRRALSITYFIPEINTKWHKGAARPRKSHPTIFQNEKC